jgi:hypothetical protein
VVGLIGQGERIYHINYYFEHLEQDKKDLLKYSGAGDFNYTKAGGCLTLAEGVDRAEFQDMTDVRWHCLSVSLSFCLSAPVSLPPLSLSLAPSIQTTTAAVKRCGDETRR